MKYAFYPGCAMYSSAKEYHKSFKAISRYFDIELQELKNWTCCAPTAAHGVSTLLSIAIPCANLAEVEKEGNTSVVVPCAACFSRFKNASFEFANDKELQEKVKDCISYDFKNKVKIIHPLEIYNEIKPQFIIRDLSNIKVVCYYGCLLTRPPKVMQFDVCEDPQTMDDILRKLRLNVIDWSYKTDCCGATFNLTQKDIFLRLTGRVLKEAEEVDADLISVACPLCQVNLDSYQLEMKSPNIPVLYFSQIIGLAYGLSERELGLDKHFVEPKGVVRECLKE